MKRLFNLLVSIRFVPHLLVYLFSKEQRGILDYERDVWLKLNHFPKRGMRGFMTLLVTFPEYRSLFYFRTGKNWLSWFVKGQTNLYFHMKSEQIGKGLMIWHGYSTVLNAKRIGENCQIWQNVTLGKKTIYETDDRPTIGNNVSMCTGSVIVGDISIGNGVIVGANATVVKNVPEKCTVVGSAVRIIK